MIFGYLVIFIFIAGGLCFQTAHILDALLLKRLKTFPSDRFYQDMNISGKSIFLTNIDFDHEEFPQEHKEEIERASKRAIKLRNIGLAIMLGSLLTSVIMGLTK